LILPIRGRPPKPSAIKKLTGNPGKRKIPVEKDFISADLKPPTYLNARAQGEWKRLAKELIATGLLKATNAQIFAGYCEAFSMWREANERIKATGLLTKGSAGNVVANPLIKIAQMERNAMMQFAVELRITKHVQTSIPNFNDNQPENEFESLLSSPSASAH
jgi:P27 family predicted phage terminase small subunit